jgi:predicted MPP superfamily phosphohydrolase
MFIASLLVLILAIWFLPFRNKFYFNLKRAWPLSLVMTVLLAGYILLLATGVYTQPKAIIGFLYNILGLFFFFVLYLLGLTVILEVPLICLLKKLKNKKPPKTAGIILLTLTLALIMAGWLKAQSYTVTFHEIPIRDLKNEVTLAHLPDLHLGAQRSERFLKKLVETINGLNPDIVLYNGDLVDSNLALRPELFAHFEDIQAEQYFTTGNHEFYVNTNRALDLISKANITILRSETALTHDLEIIGLEYMNADRDSADSHQVNNLYLSEELPKLVLSGRPAVLVHHSPVGVSYVSRRNIALMLSGHTHGGQVFPGTILIRRFFPYFKGRYQIRDLTLLVSQGVGTFGPWLRLGSFGEIQIIKLIPWKSAGL